jgi:predicted nuclease with TOPRIM domain
MDVVSQVNPIEEDITDQSQWQQQDDLNVDDNNTTDTGGLSEELRNKLEECQNQLDRLHNEKASINAQLAELNNPVLRVKRILLNFKINSFSF